MFKSTHLANGKILLGLIMFVMTGILIFTLPTAAAPSADCEAFSTSSIPDLTSLPISVTCSQDSVVYFGACDSGGVPNDDWFNITYNGSVVSANSYVGGLEYVTISSAAMPAGTNVAMLNSLSTTIYPPATYSYAISSDETAVTNYLNAYCGTDFTGAPPPAIDACTRAVPVFTQDTAPEAGTLQFRVQFGEENQPEGYLLREWSISQGQQINNDTAFVIAPQYVRLWWQPDGASDWYLLPSQYWMGDGTTDSEYGVSCDDGGVPSYHTAFGDAINAVDVPLLNQ